MKIAVTGGLGSGKSTVSKILASSLECVRIDTDELCRNQLQPGNVGMERLKEVFGYRFINPDGTLNRQALRRSTFQDHAVKSQLETILHPVVREIVNDRWDRRKDGEAHLVVEVPLLYEVQWQSDFDQCIVVYVPEHLVYQRVVRRSALDMEEIRRIINAQMPIEEKLAYTPFIVDNSTTLASTVLQTAYLVRTLLR
ncbi:MAG: dephospho-CoA kinase [Deltaproteobacteria bacterium]|nr:dephospho-CoA kinase [Deltaproteobacteria bacterium]MBW2658132.1 dephospho-CoA kinase [Deltaproteobacteria bacterium]